MLEVLYHHAKFGGVQISTAIGWPKRRVLVCWFVCLSVTLLSVTLLSVTLLSVTLLNVRVCAPDFAMKALEYRNNFDAVG